MKTFILFWNPAISSYKLDDFQRELEELINRYNNMNWSVWEYEKACAGDCFFMVRCGNGNTGICMSGYFSSDPYRDEDWSGRGRVTYYMNLEPDVMIHPDYYPILSTSELVRAIPTFDWKGGHSGRFMDENYASKLEQLWASFQEQHPEVFIHHSYRNKVNPMEFISSKDEPIYCILSLTHEGKINAFNYEYKIKQDYESVEKAKQEVSAILRQQIGIDKEIVFEFDNIEDENQGRFTRIVEQILSFNIPQECYRLVARQYDEQYIMAILLFCLAQYGNVDPATFLEQGFSGEVVDAVVALLPIKGETEDQHIRRIARNEIASDLKEEMLEEELDIKGLDEISDKDFIRLNKALREWKILKTKAKS